MDKITETNECDSHENSDLPRDHIHYHEPASSAQKTSPDNPSATSLLSNISTMLVVFFVVLLLVKYLWPKSINSTQQSVTHSGVMPPAQPTQPTQPIQPKQPQDLQDDKGGDWYVIQNITDKCVPDEGPAEMIKNLKTLGQPYQVVEDIVEGDKPMQVRLLLNDGVESGQIVYYRGKSRCEAQVLKKKQANDAELERYK